MRKILLYAHDPGGANTLIPLVKPLRKRGYLVKLLGGRFALERYAKFGLKGISLDKLTKTSTVASLTKFIAKEKADCVITGTSHLDFTEKYLWKAAEGLEIPSFAIIDNWMNYAIRFSKYNGSQMGKFRKNKSLIYYPTKIFIMDGFAKRQAIKDGVEPSKIVVTGQPYFELIKTIKQTVSPNRKVFTITYASQPISALNKMNRNFIYQRGYDENTILRNIVKALEKFLLKHFLDRKVVLIVKLHPRQAIGSHKAFLRKTKDLEIVFDSKSDSRELILKSDLVLGISSIFLIESAILQRPIVCVQTGLKGKSNFVLAQKGLLKPVLTHKALIKEFENVLLKKRIRMYNIDMVENPVKNVIGQVEKYL